MNIRQLQIDQRVLPAPLTGYTDRAFRDILRLCGVTLTYTGMINATGVVRHPEEVLSELLIDDEPRPVAVQIFGNEPEIMADAAQLLAEHNISLLDVNFSCPMKKIVKAGYGAALLRQPKLAIAIISTIRRRINLPLTVKIRAGWDQDSLNYIELAQALVDAGADAICLHPRTQSQLFHGSADWQMIARLKQHLRVPVIGNGDVRSPAAARKMQELTRCDAVMVGRAIIGNPWFLSQANAAFSDTQNPIVLSPPPLSGRLELILKHYQLAVKYFGEHLGILRMRKHLVRYLSGLPHAAFLRQKIMTFKTLVEIQFFLDELKDVYSYHRN